MIMASAVCCDSLSDLSFFSYTYFRFCSYTYLSFLS